DETHQLPEKPSENQLIPKEIKGGVLANKAQVAAIAATFVEDQIRRANEDLEPDLVLMGEPKVTIGAWDANQPRGSLHIRESHKAALEIVPEQGSNWLIISYHGQPENSLNIYDLSLKVDFGSLIRPLVSGEEGPTSSQLFPELDEVL